MLLIVSSIVLVAYQVVEIDDVAGGLLYYVAQSFLLAGSIFGLDQYVRIINQKLHSKNRPFYVANQIIGLFFSIV